MQTPPIQKPPTINQRLENQQDRIGQGITSGQLTAGEAANLETKESAITNEVRADRQANGGKADAGGTDSGQPPAQSHVKADLSRQAQRCPPGSLTRLPAVESALENAFARRRRFDSCGAPQIRKTRGLLSELGPQIAVLACAAGATSPPRSITASAAPMEVNMSDSRNRQHRFRPTCQRAAQLSEGPKRIQTARPGLADRQPDTSPGRFRHPVAVAGQQPADRRGHFRRDRHRPLPRPLSVRTR